jgi:hypothetical protein
MQIFYNLSLTKYINRKMKKSLLKYLPIYICSILLFSCENDITLEIKVNDKRLLVDGEFTNDSVIHSIKLHSSGSLITGQPQTTVSGASVYVTDKVDTFFFFENKDTLGLYQTSVKCCGKGGKVYYLSITNVDIDNDGTMDSYTANSMMPVPVRLYSLVLKPGVNGDEDFVLYNYAKYKLSFNGPDYVYSFALVNGYIKYGTVSDRLGSGEINRFENEDKVPNVVNPDSVLNGSGFFSINSNVKVGDTICFTCLNYSSAQYEFLKQFDNNTNGDTFWNNLYDQLKVPNNLPTNIEPSEKAAGYFFVYSVSKISKVFGE